MFHHYTVIGMEYNKMVNILSDHGIDSFQYLHREAFVKKSKNILHNVYFYCEPNSDLFKIMDPEVWINTPDQNIWFTERGSKYVIIQIDNKKCFNLCATM